jgi:hypothetical protein
MPYLIGGTITGTIMAYYYGFLFSIIVNSIIWFAISTLVNKFYWKYTGFKGEFQLISKYIDRLRKRKSKKNLSIKLDDHKEVDNTDRWYFSIDKRNNKTDNLGRSSKIKNLGK